MKRYLPLFLASKGLNVRIETNGSCSLYDEEEIQHYAGNIPIDLYYVLDIKSISSGMSDKNVFKENFSKMKSGDEIKFVVGNKEDIEYAFKVIEDYKAVISSKNVIINFSPIFHMIEPKEIVDVLKDRNQYFVEHNLNARLSLQIHKYIWPPEARGV
jgi:7-carboxy-7-deazaguanine synthase